MLKLFWRFWIAFSLLCAHADAQTTIRPMIWVKPQDKPDIVKNIETHKWMKDYYHSFVNRVQQDLDAYQKNPKQYLSSLPFDFSEQKTGQIPPFYYINNADKEAAVRRNRLQHFVKTAIDCGVIYYLTGEEKYVKYSTTVFHTFIKSMLQLQPSETLFNGGLIYQDDHLRESREVGAQIPILYDFIYPYIAKGGKAYNFVTATEETVSIPEAEKIFRTYVHLAIDHGIIDCNWPVLESPSLVSNILALDSEAERKKFLQYYLEKDTPHQDALPKVASVYKKSGEWPESLNYSNGVSGLSTYLMTLLCRLDSSLHLGRKYPEVIRASTLPYNLTFPDNKTTILFGDGIRDYNPAFVTFELAYYLGKLENSADIIHEFGSLLKTALADSSYRRSVLSPRSYAPRPYFDEPLTLLWYIPEITGDVKVYPKPVTFELPFAGILLQRNLSSSGKPRDGLMGFVGGGAFVHGHASGMNMEIYGQGYVLGAKGGKSEYGSDIHENYYRLFAGHNTVIVNGASRGEGGWINLAINTVKKIAIEPAPYAKAVSDKYSFTTSGFTDDKGDGAEAQQERTLGIIRTSPYTGYYIDIYRSESKLPNQFHDYIYHNIGDTLLFTTVDKNFVIKPDEGRYKTIRNIPYAKGDTYTNPGWHYFTDVESSENYEKEVQVLFAAKRLEKQPVYMKLFIPGDKQREYSRVLAPPSTEAEKVYKTRPTPTLVIRKNGEAWKSPFVVVYESFSGKNEGGSIQSVENIIQDGTFKGVIVKSIVNGNAVHQLVISQDSDNAVFEDKSLQIKFKGRYAVVSLNAQQEIKDLYIGSGSAFSYHKWSMQSANGEKASLSLDVVNTVCTVTSTAPFRIEHPESVTISEKKLKND